MSKPAFVYVTYISTTPEKLWKALTSSEFTRQYWFGTTWDTDWKAGSKFTMLNPEGQKTVTGELLEVNPLRRLVFSFHSEKPGCENEKPSRVSYDIEREDEHLKLTVTHDQFEEGSKVFGMISGGWPKVLSGLKSLLETGKALHTAGCVTK